MQQPTVERIVDKMLPVWVQTGRTAIPWKVLQTNVQVVQ